ncbi:hypothetical protein [Alistipes sp.]
MNIFSRFFRRLSGAAVRAFHSLFSLRRESDVYRDSWYRPDPDEEI